MSKEKIGLIEKSLISKKIVEYEIYFIDTEIYETEFIKSAIASEREVNKLEYVIRILSQKGKETGIGIVKGNSLEPKDIDKNIETCVLLSKNNSSSKYYFPKMILPWEQWWIRPLPLLLIYWQLLLRRN